VCVLGGIAPFRKSTTICVGYQAGGDKTQGCSVFRLETSERRLNNRRCIEIKRAGLAECPVWLRYGSPLRAYSAGAFAKTE